MRATSGVCGGEGRDGGGGCEPRLGRVRIVRVGYERNELYDETGRGYYELPGGLWAEFGPVREGSVRYWGSGSHAGHINLLPALAFQGGRWASLLGGRAERSGR